MRKVFIPRGEIATHDSLYTDRVVVKGVLRVNGKLSAKEIVGGGIIEAREIVCDDISADHITADSITAKRIAANKLFVQFECQASEAIAVRDYATAGYVSTGVLSLTLSDIQACDADKVIILKKKKSLVGLLWASWWRGLYLDVFHGGKKAAQKGEQSTEEMPRNVPAAEQQEESSAATAPDDEVAAAAVSQDNDTFDLIICLLNEAKKHGFVVTKYGPGSADTKDVAA